MEIEWVILIVAICFIFRGIIIMSIMSIGAVLFLIMTVIFIFMCETWDRITR